MNLQTVSTNESRQSTSVGIWSCLLAVMALVPEQLTLFPSIALLCLVSLAAAAALLLTFSVSFSDRDRQKQLRLVSTIVSFAIPLIWAGVLGNRLHSNASSVHLAVYLAALVPICAICVLTLPSASLITREWFPLLNDFSLLVSPAAEKSISNTTSAESATYSVEQSDSRHPFDISKSKLQEPQLAQASLQQTLLASHDQEEDFECLHEGNDVADSHVTQWFTRSMTDQGEFIEGGVRVAFADGQRDQTIHVSFCPPFTLSPEVSTEDLDGANLEIRVAAVFPYGMRLVVRRARPRLKEEGDSSTQSFRVGFVAMVAPIQRAA